ncbi:hypothetical protein [Micromonospora fulviviridis]|uniref:hypothetical protein n=1 Tax=Micromonospora fulviviridis TaxID=47860 RepID=UPI00379CEA30
MAHADTIAAAQDDGTTGAPFTYLHTPRSGAILAAHERQTGRKPGLISYVLILVHGQTASAGGRLRAG